MLKEMPPKLRGHSEEGTEQELGQGATGGLSTAEVTSSGGEGAITSLARMFESFMAYQRNRDDRQERETARREQQYKVLQHQVSQIPLDFEHTRAGVSTTGRPAGGMDQELRMARLEDNDDIKHYLTTFERLAEVFKWPKEDWAIRLVPLLTGKARSAFVSMDPMLTKDYNAVKQAILSKYEINSETYRLRFRGRETAEETP